MSEELGNIEFSLTNLISGLTFCSFILGIINLTVYYYFFHFNVFSYIELSEIAIQVIKDGILILLPIIILLISIIFKGKTINASTSNAIKQKNYNVIRYLIILGIILIGIFIFYEYFINKISLPFLLYFIFSFFAPYIWDLPFKIKRHLEQNSGIKINAFSFVLLSAVILCITGGVFNALIKVDSVKYKHINSGTYILMGKDTIKSNDNYYYFGRTKNYVFFYNEKTQYTDIYQEKDINKLSIHFY